MSHFDAVTTKITNKGLLKESIVQAGYLARENFGVRGYNQQCLAASVVCVMPGNYDIGFQLVGDNYQAVADFAYGSCGGGDATLHSELLRIIAIYATKEAMMAAQTNRHLESANISVKVH